MSARIVGEDDVVEAVVLRIRIDAQHHFRARVAGDRVRLAVGFQSGVVVAFDTDVHLNAIGATERVLQLVHATLDGSERRRELVVRFVAVEQFADGSFAAADMAGDVVEIVGGGAKVFRQSAQVFDDLPNVGAILTDCSADRVRDVIDRRGEFGDLRLQLLGDDARIGERGIDVRLIRGDDLAHLRGDGADVVDDVFEPLLSLRSA